MMTAVVALECLGYGSGWKGSELWTELKLGEGEIFVFVGSSVGTWML